MDFFDTYLTFREKCKSLLCSEENKSCYESRIEHKKASYFPVRKDCLVKNV